MERFLYVISQRVPGNSSNGFVYVPVYEKERTIYIIYPVALRDADVVISRRKISI